MCPDNKVWKAATMLAMAQLANTASYREEPSRYPSTYRATGF